MRLEQGHTRSRRSPEGPATRRHGCRTGIKTDAKNLVTDLGGRGGLARLAALGGDRRQALRAGRRGGRGGAIGHPAGAGGLAGAAARLILRRRHDDRLHLREGGADDGDEKPDETFHGVEDERNEY
jgi:hypothetical protein